MLDSIFPKEPYLRRLVKCLLVLSFIVLFFACGYGYHQTPDAAPENYKAYFDKPNWFLYPVFYLIVGLIVRATWEPFQRSWVRAGELRPAVIASRDGTPIDSGQAAEIVGAFDAMRSRAIPIAIVLGVLWGAVDGGETRAVYLLEDVQSQLVLAREAPDFTVKWVFVEHDVEHAKSIAAPWHQVAIYFMLEVEQAFLIGLGFLVLMQVLLQVSVFTFLEHPRIFAGRFRVVLLHKAPSKDFGLGDWNRALDVFYWLMSLGLMIAVISKFSQPVGNPDVGQIMGQWLLGFMLAAPFLITVAGRVNKVRILDQWLDEHGSEADWQARHDQNGWPMDPKRMQKVGFAICMVLYAVYAGKDSAALVGRLIG